MPSKNLDRELEAGENIKTLFDVMHSIHKDAGEPFPPTTEESPDFKHDTLVFRFLWATILIAALSFASGYFCRGLF